MTEPKHGFLIDASRCIDCRTCLVACSVENNVPMTHTRIWMKDTGITGDFPDLSRYTAPYHCMHCTDPSCVSACTVGALQQNEDGVVVYDAERCIGCRYCMYACPFGVPNFEWEKSLALIVKCDLCFERLEEGQQPACAATCPTEAIKFGTHADMLQLAHTRIAQSPEKYIDHVYGEHENGGTSTFYISPVPFEQLGFPVTERQESPAEFNRLVTHGTPVVAAGVAIGMTGIYLAIERQSKDNAAAEAEAEAEHIENAEKDEHHA
jgi:formate dehydrogenase iron-sulfur subunit